MKMQPVAYTSDTTPVRKRLATLAGIERGYPEVLIRSVHQAAQLLGKEVYLVGGCVRDWLLGRTPRDLDLAVSKNAELFGRQLINALEGGTLVELGTDEEEAVRVIWRGWEVDIAAFRGGSTRIEEDLVRRDFTINSLAVPLGPVATEKLELIDPTGGLVHLEQGVVQCCRNAFTDDPLRLLRTFRFSAALDFAVSETTLAEVARHALAITMVAAERIQYELDLIMASGRAAAALTAMHEAGLLKEILGELYAGLGVEQPGFHHLDVFHHNLQALREMELLQQECGVFAYQRQEIDHYLADRSNRVRLKWAALLHDLGKPQAEDQSVTQERITFHGHDEIGRKLVERLARRLKWSNEDRQRTSHLVGMHMHPFHLCNVQRDQPLSKRAALKLCRRAGDDLPGLFLLAMADSLAGCGELKPPDMERELEQLYQQVAAVWRDHIQPALAGPPLVNGHDLIRLFHLAPGPIFSTILDELLARQVEDEVTTREEALSWVATYLAHLEQDRPEAEHAD